MTASAADFGVGESDVDAGIDDVRAAWVAGHSRVGAAGEWTTRALLAPLALPFVPATRVGSAEQACAAARAFGGPVVLKVLSDAALHKTELGLVELGLADPAAVAACYTRLSERVAELGLTEAVVVVQPMAPPGVDLFLGIDRDPAFGPVLVVGLGGTTVELFRDVARRVLPASTSDVTEMLSSLRSAALLTGFRGAPVVDTAAFSVLAATVARLVERFPAIGEIDLNPVRVLPNGECVVLDAAAVLRVPEPAVSPRVGPRDLRPLLGPKTIAVVGASRDASRPGGRVLRSLLEHGFPDRVLPVNPAGGRIAGLDAATGLAELPEVPDLVCIALPAAAAVESVRECVALGVRAVIVFASGFAEAGPEGRELDARLRAAVAGSGTVLCGPNTIGVVDAHVPMAATFSSTIDGLELRPSRTCLIAQSGAVAGSLVSRELAEGYGIGGWVTVGNQSDVDVADYLEHYAASEHVGAVALFLEGVPDGARFRAALRTARRAGTPVVVFKSGVSSAGGRAVASHSGALAGSGDVYRALLDQEGAIRVDRMTDLLPVAWTAATQRPPLGPRVAVVSTSGGAGSAAVDLVVEHGLEVARLEDDTRALLAARLPSFARADNPLDVTAEGAFTPGLAREVVEIVGGDPGVDAVCVVLTGVTGAEAERIAGEVADASDRLAAPVFVTWLVTRTAAASGMALLATRGLRVFAEPADMVLTVARLAGHRAVPLAR
ncbi:acetate--CoA ligase family protein [Pseudonocardia sp.]|uniref:acetate--CoA ligase family protein n=1 Tax=Pseudonocardia sp. TaxID=60912 RepID=UPI003D0FBA14